MNRATRTPPDKSVLPRELDAQRVDDLVDAAGDLVVVLDGQGTVLDVRGHDREQVKALRRDWRQRPWIDTVTVESREKLQALLQSAIGAAPDSGWRQVNHPMSEGADLPMLYRTVRVAGAARGAATTRLVAIGRDLRDTVTLQRRLVEAQQSMERDYWRFREAETRYRHLFQASAEAVLIVDGATLRVAEANPAALALLEGSKSARVVGAALASLFEPGVADTLAAVVAAARSVGKHESLVATLAGGGRSVLVHASAFRHEQAAFLLVRLLPQAEPERAGRRRTADEIAEGPAGLETPGMAAAYVRAAGDALAFTDAHGRVVAVNRAFARLTQLSGEDQARGEPLDRWLGRTGVELSVLLTNLREGGAAGLFTTELRGELGLRTEVEIAASAIEPPGAAAYAFAVRDVGRRLAVEENVLPVPASTKQLTELVGRVPLKQIVAETSDLIERLSIEAALQMTRDNRALAAQLLGLSRQSLYVKLRRFGIGGLTPGDEE
jgi:transcriptional regulator PpsR